MLTRNQPHTMESLLARTVQSGDCLLWQGATLRSGYGVARYMGKQTTAHRISLSLHTGQAIPTGMEVDHTCGNRTCINPEHLQLVSHAENMKLGRNRRSTCRAGHAWSEENTYWSTVKRKQGGTRLQRFCRACRAKVMREFRTKRTT